MLVILVEWDGIAVRTNKTKKRHFVSLLKRGFTCGVPENQVLYVRTRTW